MPTLCTMNDIKVNLLMNPKKVLSDCDITAAHVHTNTTVFLNNMNSSNSRLSNTSGVVQQYAMSHTTVMRHTIMSDIDRCFQIRLLTYMFYRVSFKGCVQMLTYDKRRQKFHITTVPTQLCYINEILYQSIQMNTQFMLQTNANH